MPFPMSLGSFLRLGLLFLKRLFVRLVLRPSGLRRFEENYFREDRLLPVAEVPRARFAAFSACIACGMCDAVFDAEVDRTVFPGPSYLPLSFSRNLPDYDALGPYLTELRKGDLVALERVCPTRVPFRQLADFVEAHAAGIAQQRKERGPAS